MDGRGKMRMILVGNQECIGKTPTKMSLYSLKKEKGAWCSFDEEV